MDTFAVKLLLTPTLIGLITLAGRRWGPAISGLLVSLPLTSGPIVFFVALDQGVSVAIGTAMGTLAGTISLAAFSVVYRRSAFRFGWLVTILLSSLVFTLSTVVLRFLNLALIPLYLLVILSLILALHFTGKDIHASSTRAQQLPNWDIPARMLVATTYVVLLTAVVPRIGARLTGLLSPFPLYTAILAVFAHRLEGPSPAVKVIHGLVVGLFGFATFFVVLSGLLPQLGITVAFAAGIVILLTIQVAAVWMLRRTIGQ